MDVGTRVRVPTFLYRQHDDSQIRYGTGVEVGEEQGSSFGENLIRFLNQSYSNSTLINGEFPRGASSFLVPHGDEIYSFGEAGDVDGEAFAAVAVEGGHLLPEEVVNLDMSDVLAADSDGAGGWVGMDLQRPHGFLL